MIKIHPKSKQAYKLLHEGILALARAERQGIRLDVDYIRRKKKQLKRKMARIEEEFMSSSFYKDWVKSLHGKKPNVNSGLQLSKYLYEVKNLKPKKCTDKGNPSVDDEALSYLHIPELDTYLKKKKYKSLWDKLDGFEREEVDGFMHPFFNLHLVSTFRSSSDSPNFQNIHKRDKESMRIVRQAILPREGHQLLEADFSGIEVRVAVCYHNDPNMIKYIEDPTTDMHGDMAKQIFKVKKIDKKIPAHAIMRQAAKNGFVFPQFYGDYFKTCAANLCEWVKLPQTRWKSGEGIELQNGLFISDHMINKGIKSFGKETTNEKGWKDYTGFIKHIQTIEKDFWENRFPRYKAWKEEAWELYQKYGYVPLKTGFQCTGVMRKNECVNYPVQGAAFHCLLWSFTRIDEIMREEKWDTKIVGQIHDSIILDVNPDELEHVAEVIKKVTTQELTKAFDWIIIPMDIEMELCPVDAPWVEKEIYKV